jgi:peptidoglycan hydrolase FlgJ
MELGSPANALSPLIAAQASQPSAPRVDTTGTPEKVRATAVDFEAFFITQMFEHMFSGIETDGPFGGGSGEKIFRSMLMQEYGAETARQGGFGIADTIVRQLLATQEVGS